MFNHVLFTWILICSAKTSSETCPETWMTSGLCVFLQAQSLLQPGVSPVCRFVGFCLLRLFPRRWEKSMHYQYHFQLAFGPSLKGWGVPQGWCLTLAPFVSSNRVWKIPDCCDLCCACSSHSGKCQVPLFWKVLCMWCYSLFSFFQVELVRRLNHREIIFKICHSSFVAFLWLRRPTISTGQIYFRTHIEFRDE